MVYLNQKKGKEAGKAKVQKDDELHSYNQDNKRTQRDGIR